MNNPNNSFTPAMVEAIIQETYQSSVFNWIFFGALSLLVYTTLLSAANEVEYIWSKTFSIPTLLYISARYGGIASHALLFGINFLPAGRACNIIADAANSANILGYIGVQGLLIARTYALCQGNKIISVTLALFFLVGLVLDLYGIITLNGCITTETAQGELLNLIGNIFTILTDAIVFGACLWQVWGTWKLKREARIESRRDLVSKLFGQIISRFCFVVVTSLIGTIIQPTVKSSLVVLFETIQQALSVILIADFTLDLRRHSSTTMAPDRNAPSFSMIQFNDVLQRLHQSIITEMGEPEFTVADSCRDDDVPAAELQDNAGAGPSQHQPAFPA